MSPVLTRAEYAQLEQVVIPTQTDPGPGPVDEADLEEKLERGTVRLDPDAVRVDPDTGNGNGGDRRDDSGQGYYPGRGGGDRRPPRPPRAARIILWTFIYLFAFAVGVLIGHAARTLERRLGWS